MLKGVEEKRKGFLKISKVRGGEVESSRRRNGSAGRKRQKGNYEVRGWGIAV